VFVSDIVVIASILVSSHNLLVFPAPGGVAAGIMGNLFGGRAGDGVLGGGGGGGVAFFPYKLCNVQIHTISYLKLLCYKLVLYGEWMAEAS